eukprot:gnl/MRDRNA2_/MRDRNA2_81221_c0_seq1.p1 gnl/MRDRNA2_/MRDRNA2_81221_c0~~gnl/MRDRNA2_/MRDRNA2_81221_c0_seq1.p1  ORF type:complete len:120 (-),score=13.18 gnl/MRDRNA2_/MRDRNA2_81221_c0_seq1:636-950(-)
MSPENSPNLLLHHGLGGVSTGPCMPMTDTDPCFEKSATCINDHNCTKSFCANLGKIGCDNAQCVFMDMGDMSHCMSPDHPLKLLSQRDLEGFSWKNPLAQTILI